MNLNQQIKKYRESHHLSQEELAEKIYVSRQTISNWETGRSYPDIHNLLLLSVFFDVSLDELVKGDLSMMKKEISKDKWNFWTCNMALFMLVTPLSMAPALRFLGYKGLIISVISGIWMMVSALMLEKMKKENNIKTYSEIVAFIENKEVDQKKVETERQKHEVTKGLMFMGSAIITLVLIAISFFLFY